MTIHRGSQTARALAAFHARGALGPARDLAIYSQELREVIGAPPVAALRHWVGKLFQTEGDAIGMRWKIHPEVFVDQNRLRMIEWVAAREREL